MSLIKIVDVAHVRFAAPDLGKMAQFLEDFGFSTFTKGGRLYGQGTDGRPYQHVTEAGDPAFLALGLLAESEADLTRLAEAEGVAVEDNPEPGGGKLVRLVDPDGFAIEVVAGQAQAAGGTGVPDPVRNSANARQRFDARVTLEPGPSHVQRLGHCVLNVTDFRASERWYKDRFGLLTSDEVEIMPDHALGAFMRCDRGAEPTDHHTLFLAQGPGEPRLLHAAFEVANFDDLMTGHEHLAGKDYQASWGVGRHIMGSQIFDYWLDPWGHELEHWTDGDLLTADFPPEKRGLPELLAVQWGAQHASMAGAQG